jgi:glyoxalase family protein
MTTIPGLHHVTAISGPPQENLDFFTGTLKQRLVKTTVNFDAPDTYHL